MGTKIGSSIATFLLTVPLTAVGLMAIFGVPEFTPVIASPDETVVIRDPYESRTRSGNGRQELSSPPEWTQDELTGQGGSSWSDGESEFRGMSEGASSRINGYEDAPYSSSVAFPGARGGRGALPRRGAAEQERPAHGRDSWEVSDRQSPDQSQWVEGRPSRTALGPASVVEQSPVVSRTSQAVPVSWREASRRLAEMGVENYHLERGATDQSFLFVCLFSPGDAPQVTHRFEAEADDPLLAVNDVLRQIDSWLQKRFAAQNFPDSQNRL